MLQSDLCHWSKGTIIAEGTITVTDPNNNAYDKKLAFKDNAPFISCITKINNALIDNVEDLDIVLPMHNLIEQRKIIQKHQEVYAIIIEMNQIVVQKVI